MKTYRLIFLFPVAACVMTLSSSAQEQQSAGDKVKHVGPTTVSDNSFGPVVGESNECSISSADDVDITSLQHKSGRAEHRQVICHVSGHSFRTITVAERAVPSHLSHGDSLGPCPTVPVCGDGIVEPPEECDDGNLVDDDGCQSDCTLTGSSSTPTGQVYWFNGNGLNPEAGNGYNWVEIDNPADNSGDNSYEVESFSAQWSSSLDTGENYFVWGRKDGSVWYAPSSNTPWTAYRLHDTGWASGVDSIQAKSYDGSFALQVVAGLADGSIQYWTAVDPFYEGTWVQLHDEGWGSAAKFLAVQWPSENGYNGKLRVVVGLENSASVFYDGDTWRDLHDDQWDSQTTAMQAYFSDEDYWPAVVQGLENGAVVYFDTSGIWHALHDDGWASAVNRMQVQFPQENDQDYVKVVVGLENSSLLYYDGTGVSIGSDSIGWYELHDDQWDSSTEGLCAYFPTDNNDEDNIKVVTGLGDGAVLYWNSGGFSELAASGVEGTNVGVADLHCSWEHGVVEVVATYANSPVVYYSEDDAYTCLGGTNDGEPCPGGDNSDCPNGACTKWKSLAPYDVGDNNQLQAFSANFAGTPTTGVPRVAGGYQRPGSSIVKWLECKVCNKVVNKLINDAVSELDCDENCIEFAQEFGGGPEDPVADFVSAACIYICPKFVDRVSGEGAQEVCTEANMCN